MVSLPRNHAYLLITDLTSVLTWGKIIVMIGVSLAPVISASREAMVTGRAPLLPKAVVLLYTQIFTLKYGHRFQILP